MTLGRSALDNPRSDAVEQCGDSKCLGRRKSSADTIGDIKRAAAEEFAAHGFDCATVERIARRANVSKQLLYYYYGNKAELYSLILEEAAMQSPEFERDIDVDGLDPAYALKAFIGIVFEDYERRPHIVQMTMDEAQHNFAHIGPKCPLAGRLQDTINVLDRILRRGADAGVLRRGVDADALFWTIFSLVTTWFSQSSMISLVSGEKLGGDGGLRFWRESATRFVLQAVACPEPESEIAVARTRRG